MEQPRWKLLSNSPKAHLFVDGRSLCRRWAYMGRDYDGPWTGGVNRDDCPACVKAARKKYPAPAPEG